MVSVVSLSHSRQTKTSLSIVTKFILVITAIGSTSELAVDHVFVRRRHLGFKRTPERHWYVVDCPKEFNTKNPMLRIVPNQIKI